MLPEELRLSKQQRDYEQLVEYANHVQGAVTSKRFRGEDLLPVVETIRELYESLVEFDKTYKLEGVEGKAPVVKRVSQLKIHRELKEAG